MSICVCAQISMRVRESRSVAGKPSPAVRSISKPRFRGILHYITPSPAGNPRVPAIIPRGGNPCRPLIHIFMYACPCVGTTRYTQIYAHKNNKQTQTHTNLRLIYSQQHYSFGREFIWQKLVHYWLQN